MKVADIIDRLGGAPTLARALSLPVNTVANWRVRGSIPAKHHGDVLAVADGKVSAEEMIDAHRPARSGAADHQPQAAA